MLIRSTVQKIDEESGLCIDTNPRYGSVQPSSEETSSIEEGGGSSHSSIKKRKKRRMAQRQCCQPDTMTRLSTIFHQSKAPVESEDEVKKGDLVLPSLDPKYIACIYKLEPS